MPESAPAAAAPAVAHRPAHAAAPPTDAKRSASSTIVMRLFVGLVLAQGFYYGARQVGQAVLLAQGQSDWWNSLPGLLTVQAMQAWALLLGGVVAGAGHQRGLFPGALLGLANAGLILLVEALVGHGTSPQMQLIGPLLQVGVGALGGSLGARYWRPVPNVSTLPTDLDAAEATPAPKRPRRPPVPWAWGRLLLGAVLAAAGFYFNNAVLDFVTANGWHVPGGTQRHLMSWAIAGLGLMLGTGLAGAATQRGLSQGLAAGLLAAPIILIAHLVRGGDYLAGQEFVASMLDLPLGPPRLSGPMIAYLLMQTVGLGALCGWLASQLLPRRGVTARLHGDLSAEEN